MNNRSLRYAKLMKTMGVPEPKQEPELPTGDINPMSPEKIEALTGTKHPELQEKRRMKMLIDAKINQLQDSDDPNALESLNFWKQKLDALEID